MTTPMDELDTPTLDEIFERSPETLTRKDRMVIVRAEREARAKWKEAQRKKEEKKAK